MTTPLKAVAAGGNSAELREWVAGDFLPIGFGGTGVAATTLAQLRAGIGLGPAAVAAIVGTVSQSGGVPTGAIVQRGSTANGEFVRFADGTQICTNKATLSSQAIAAGGLSTGYDWTHPASFAAIPNMAYSATGSFSYAFTLGAEGVSTTQTPSIYARNSATAPLTTALTIHMTAIGRWFL